VRFAFGARGHPLGMADEERLIHDAHESLEATEELREESGLAHDEPSDGKTAADDEGASDELLDSPSEPWAKTSSGDADDA
jgi:hypothetical protein